MPEPRLSAFVSSSMLELAEERQVIRKALAEMNVDAWVFEQDAGARPQSTRKTFLKEVETADLYIGVFWKRYGQYTIDEYRHAREKRKDCLIYEKRSSLEGRDPQLDDFLREINKVESGLTIKWFQQAEELGAQVKEDVARWLAERVRSRRPIPLERPPRANHFTDRRKELDQLIHDLQPGRVVTLLGPGGIGKSALATEALWSIAPGDDPPGQFPDGIFYHTFYNQPKVDHALEAIVLAYEDDARPTPRLAAKRVLSSRVALLMLDSAENADDLSAIMDVRGNCGVLVTSRSRRGREASSKLTIRPLDIGEAVSLLKAWGGERATPDDVNSRICELLGRLPLAVLLVGCYLSEQEENAADYLVWLEKTPLEALGQVGEESIPMLLEKSLGQVSEGARQAVAVVGRLALSPFLRQPIAAAMGLEPAEAGRRLGELVQYGLLLREEEHYSVSHSLVHTYARELPAPGETVEKLSRYFIEFAQSQAALGLQGYPEMDKARPHTVALLPQLVEQESWEPVVAMAQVLTRSRDEGYLQIRGYWQDERNFIDQGILACNRLIEAASPDGRAGWLRRLADLKYSLGDLQFNRDQYEEAVRAFKESLSLYEQLAGRQLESAHARLKLGEIRLNQGDFDQAVTDFEESLATFQQQQESSRTLAKIHLLLGRAFHRKESYEQAQPHYEKSLDYYHRIGDAEEGAYILVQMGALAFAKGAEDCGRENFSRAEDQLNQARGDRRRIAIVRMELANEYRWKKIFDKAIELQQQCIQDFEALGDRRNMAWSLQALGDTNFEKGDHAAAEKNYQEVLPIFDELGISHGKAYAFDHMGMIRLAQGKTDEARNYFERALPIFQASSLRSGIAYLLFNLGDTERAAGNYEKARERYQASLEIWESLPNTMRAILTKDRLAALADEATGKK